jgi:hypothetical protein
MNRNVLLFLLLFLAVIVEGFFGGGATRHEEVKCKPSSACAMAGCERSELMMAGFEIKNMECNSANDSN